MKNILTISLIISLFALPLLTSWLLDLHWINSNWTRKTLVYLLMLFEMAAILFMLKTHIKNLLKK